MELQKDKNKQNEFFNKDNSLKNDKERFLWFGNLQDLDVLINCIPFCDSSFELIDLIFFSNKNLIFENEQTFILLEKMKKLNYTPLVISVIFNFLQINYKKKNMSLNYGERVKIVPILVKPKLSNSVLNLMSELNVLDFLIKTKTKSQFHIAVLLYFNTIYSFNTPYCDLEGICNLLNFLKVDKYLIRSLTDNQKDFDDLKKFLTSYNFENPVTSS